MNTEEYVNLTVKLIENNKWPQVKKSCYIQMAKDPTNPHVHFFMGMYFKHFNSIDAAKTAFMLCLKNDPNYFLAYINLIRLLSEQNNMIESLEFIARAKELFPNENLLYIESSDVYLKIEDYVSAIANIKIAIELKPDFEIAIYNYGHILHKLFDKAILDYNLDLIEDYYHGAIIQYLKVLKINNKNIFAICNYATILVDKADFIKKQSNIQLIKIRELERNHEFRKAYILRYKIELQYIEMQSLYIDGKVLYMKVLDIDPLDPDVYYNLGRISTLLNEYDDARKYYMKAIEIKPNYSIAIENLKNISILQTEYDNTNKYNKYKKIPEIRSEYREAKYNKL